MAADIRYGGRVQVDFSGVVRTLEGKLDADCANLSMLLVDSEGQHNFEEQVRLLKEIQASVRTLDVLKGEIDINGERSAAGLARDLQSHGKDASGNLKQTERIIPPNPDDEDMVLDMSEVLAQSVLTPPAQPETNEETK